MEQILCELCRARGLKSQLVLFQLNLDEAILLCNNRECIYPLGVAANSNLFVKRKYLEIVNTKRRKKKKEQGKLQPLREKCKNHATVPGVVRFLSSYLHWKNTGALCWLDAVMSLFVHNVTVDCILQTFDIGKDCLMRTLLTSFYTAQELLSHNRAQAEEMLADVRKRLWKYLEPKMNCEHGVNDSPVTALPLLLRESCTLSEKTLQQYRWEFSCSVCGYQQSDRRKKHLVTLPNVTCEFSLQDAVFVRPCYKCGVEGQASKLVYEKMPQCLFLHFESGLKSDDILYHKCKRTDGHYIVTQLIQYKRKPNHFVSWIREHQGSKWMEVDDLKSPICGWRTATLMIPPSEVHIVVWEKVCSDVGNSLVSTTTDVTGQTSSFQGLCVKEEKTICLPPVLKVDCKESVDSFEIKKLPPLLPVTTGVQVASFPLKSKSGPVHFEPYIPRKKRCVSQSCPNSPACHNVFKSDSSVHISVPLSSPPSPTFFSWHDLTEQGKEKMNPDDFQSDSGYSSPASVSSCGSLPLTQSLHSFSVADGWEDMNVDEKHDDEKIPDVLCTGETYTEQHFELHCRGLQSSHTNTCTPEANSVDELCPSGDLANKIELLLPDCLLENHTKLEKSAEDSVNGRLNKLQELSAEQDRFIVDLLRT